MFVSKWGTYGTADGEFQNPYGVAMASDSSVYVSDRGNDFIQKFTSEGVFVSKWGTYGTADGQFYSPEGVAVASDGSVYVVDSGNNRIQKFSVATPTPIATVVPATPTPIVPTPTATPVVVRPNVAGYLLKINGSYVRPGHVSIAIDNGYIMVDPMTGKDGSYPKRTEVTLGYYPDNATDVVSWSGVDTGEGSIAQVFLDRDREVIATIGP